MKDVHPVEWARRLIDDQLERLSELRNANPRDPGFKLWRQTTLTVIQRIWPGDLARCERFRRIPFSGTSPRPSRVQMREHFERGCAEASAYLKILTLELETQGLNKGSAATADPKPAQLPSDPAPAPAPPPAAPPDPRDMFEPSPFDRIQPAQTKSSASPTAAPQATPAPAPAQASRAASPPSPPAAHPAPPAGNPRKQGRLKDMLGFGEEASRSSTPSGGGASSFSNPAPPPAFAGKQEDVLDPRLEAMLAEAEETAFTAGTTPPTDDTPPIDDTPLTDDAPLTEEPLDDEPAETAVAEETASAARERPVQPGDLAIEFLSRPRTSPAQAATPAPAPRPAPPMAPTAPVARASSPAPVPPPAPTRARTPAPPAPPAPASPVPRPPETVLPAWTTPSAPVPAPPKPVAPKPPAPPPVQVAQPPVQAAKPAPVAKSSPTSAALVAIAAQVDRLGVPESQCAAASSALIDLAKQLDEGIASFDSIREILWIVADYPALARRTIPLLIPHLDLE